MDNLVDLIKSIILARQTVGVVLIIAAVAGMYAGREFLRDVWNDPAPFWRTMARLAAAALAVTFAWTAVFDDWLQLVAEPYRLSLQWNYQRVVYDPIDPAFRAVTVALVAVSLVLLACLFARHVGAYLLQAATLVVAMIVWMPLFIMNQRMNAMIVQGAEASDSLPEILGVTAFWLVRMGLAVTTVAVTLLAVTMLVALVATVVLDLFRLREVRVTHEADGFFSELGKRAEGHEDIPLKALWRPIRRPL